jgi:hypothetical protein
MLTNYLLQLYKRDLDALTKEILAYNNENVLWIKKGNISNSAGNLCLHICGNLRHFIGATLGNTGYVRDRNLEFSATSVPRKELVELIAQTYIEISTGLNNMEGKSLEATYPLPFLNEPVTYGYLLLAIYGHLHYHLGQINYHRRLVE